MAADHPLSALARPSPVAQSRHRGTLRGLGFAIGGDALLLFGIFATHHGWHPAIATPAFTLAAVALIGAFIIGAETACGRDGQPHPNPHAQRRPQPPQREDLT